MGNDNQDKHNLSKYFSVQANEQDALAYSSKQGLESLFRLTEHLDNQIATQKKHILILLVSLLCLIVLVIILFVGFMSYPKNRFIATKDNSAICEVSPQNNPNLTDASIADFAKDGVVSLYSFNYVNYSSHIEDVLGRYYTPKGRIDASKAIQSLVTEVNNKALTINSGLAAAAKIEQKGIDGLGRPYWTVSFPMIIDIYSGTKQPVNNQYFIVTAQVLADNASSQNPRGLGITAVTFVPTDANFKIYR
ncbi:DotI/IcmL family type IV secretion protein (plasmid) [Moraxella bovis]|uniref:DotI/IcmL family type IV secretion protein n=1 Tax=Moraxella bovis TaxID=476 RepID=A0ABY6MDT0_MORBO|nr:DotI/IcmL family type IV secretion protein [Moraxella bovis]UZA04806.1 DotI/IcmL family type IV secretion protein [Moraxella bovis]